MLKWQFKSCLIALLRSSVVLVVLELNSFISFIHFCFFNMAALLQKFRKNALLSNSFTCTVDRINNKFGYKFSRKNWQQRFKPLLHSFSIGDPVLYLQWLFYFEENTYKVLPLNFSKIVLSLIGILQWQFLMVMLLEVVTKN